MRVVKISFHWIGEEEEGKKSHPEKWNQFLAMSTTTTSEIKAKHNITYIATIEFDDDFSIRLALLFWCILFL